MKKYSWLILFFVYGCAVRSVYIPTTQNVFLPDDQKQLTTNAYVGSNHIELQVACNPINHFELGLNLNHGKGIRIYEGFIGINGCSKANNKWRYELQGGYGYNNNFLEQNNAWFSIFQQEKLSYETYSTYNKYFFQTSFGYFSKIEIYKLSYSFALSVRGSYNHFDKYIYRENSISITNTINKEYYNKNLYLLEPCITNKVGMKNIAGVIQGQFMIPSSKQIDVSYTKFSPVFILSIGLQYTFVYTKKNKQV